MVIFLIQSYSVALKPINSISIFEATTVIKAISNSEL